MYSGGNREARSHVAQQRAAPLAVRDSGPARARRQEVLRQILRRRHRSHQHQAVAMHIAQGKILPSVG